MPPKACCIPQNPRGGRAETSTIRLGCATRAGSSRAARTCARPAIAGAIAPTPAMPGRWTLDLVSAVSLRLARRAGAGAYHGAPAGSRRAPAASAASAIGRATAGTMGTLSGRTPSPALPSAPRCQLSVGLRRRAYHGRRADCGEAMVNTGRPRMPEESGIERATARAEAYRIIGDPPSGPRRATAISSPTYVQHCARPSGSRRHG